MSAAVVTTLTQHRRRVLEMRNEAVVAIVSMLFFVPSALMALSFRAVPRTLILCGCVGAIGLIVSRRSGSGNELLRAPLDGRRLTLCVCVAVVLLLLGGETHLLFATSDWQVRDAVLSDLVRNGLPVRYEIAGADYLLRAPLGMYMLPATVGHWLGLAAAHWALLGQNALILGCTFYLLMQLGRGWPHLAMLVLFAGLSLIGGLWRGVTPAHSVPFYMLWSLDAWNPLFQYSSSMVQFFWVPNHALPGWWIATLILLQKRSNLDVAVLGVTVAGLIFWSPLAVLPAVPWLLYQTSTAFRSVVLSARTWVGGACACCFLPLAAFLVSASGTISHGSTFGIHGFALWYALFVLIQLPALGYLYAVRRHIQADLRAPLIVNGVILLVLPFFKFGPNNDLVMRGSIASLTIVAFVFGLVVIDLCRVNKRAAAAGCALIALSTPSAAIEIWRAVATPRYAISDCTLIEASRALGVTAVPTNYVTKRQELEPWLANSGTAQIAASGTRPCWPDFVAR